MSDKADPHADSPSHHSTGNTQLEPEEGSVPAPDSYEPDQTCLTRGRSDSVISEDGGGYLSPSTEDTHLHEIRPRPAPTEKSEIKELFNKTSLVKVLNELLNLLLV